MISFSFEALGFLKTFVRSRISISATVVLFAVICSFCALRRDSIISAQTGRQHAIVEGKVRDAGGQPIAGVSLKLEGESGGRIVVREAKTTEDGSYVLKAGNAGTYRVQVEKEGYRPQLLETVRLDAGKKRIDIVMEKSTAGAGSAMEFSDTPNFTVAGVTDWANLGLHGSDANVKASEALAKETAALKSGAAGGAHIKGAGDVHRLLGDAKEKAGDPVAAVHEYETAVKLDPSEENYFAWGTELLLHRAGIAAVEVLSKGAEKHAKSERMRAALGAAYYANGQYAEAAEEMCRASDLNPGDAEPYLFLGKMEKAANEILPCSEEKLERFVKEQPKNAEGNFYYGLVLWKKARKAQSEPAINRAEKHFRQAVAIEPTFGEVYVELGMMYNARGAKGAALAEFQKAVAANPNLGDAHYQLSLAYRRAGENAKADEEIRVYERLQKAENAELEKERREMKQFVTSLKQAPAAKPN